LKHQASLTTLLGHARPELSELPAVEGAIVAWMNEAVGPVRLVSRGPTANDTQRLVV
jgi:hypothetical protein